MSHHNIGVTYANYLFFATNYNMILLLHALCYRRLLWIFFLQWVSLWNIVVWDSATLTRSPVQHRVVGFKQEKERNSSHRHLYSHIITLIYMLEKNSHIFTGWVSVKTAREQNFKKFIFYLMYKYMPRISIVYVYISSGRAIFPRNKIFIK
jgi:hypothetical protein